MKYTDPIMAASYDNYMVTPNTCPSHTHNLYQTQANSTNLPKHSSTRNFSRPIYTTESTDSSIEQRIKLDTTFTDSSLIRLSSPEPLTLITKNLALDQPSDHHSPVPEPVSPRQSSRISRAHSRPSSPQHSTTTRSKAKPSISTSILQDFFSSYSAPGPEEYPEPEDFEMDRSISFIRRTTTSSFSGQDDRSQQPASSSPTSFANTVGEKLGWLRSRAFSISAIGQATEAKTTASPKALQQQEEDAELTASDPLLNLDVESSLFPTGHADPMDPASFNSLLINASSLIETLQNAYRARTLALNNIRAEYAAQTDALDEAETRTRHLKMQLSDMSSRMVDTEASLRGQLLEERKRREELEHEEKERTARSRVVPSNASDSGFESDGDYSVSSSALSSPIRSDKESTGYYTSEPLWPRGSTIQLQGSSDLAMENYKLRQRVVELEGAVEACLQLI